MRIGCENLFAKVEGGIASYSNKPNLDKKVILRFMKTCLELNEKREKV